jgi:glycosyltransferase involved in cell wall biosynthesis
VKLTKTIWIHALAAKVGGGVTYLRAILPQLAEQLAGRGARVVLLLPTPLADVALPDFFDVRVLPQWARNPLTRFVFDQFVLPFTVWREGGTALFCSASFAPLVKPARTVVLLRNAIYFDHHLIRRETPARSLSWRLQSLLIAAGAYTCAAVMYPSQAMRAQVEACYPSLKPRGFVNLYGVNAEAQSPKPKAQSPKPKAQSFLYVMTYTLQKNLNFLLRALIQAKAEGLPVQLVVTSRLDDRPPACWEGDWRLIEEHKLIESGYLKPAGPHYGADLVELYNRVDACVFASFCESFGHPLVEALALGKPLVCADWPYAREICGASAAYFDPDKPDKLVAIWRDWPAALRAEPLDRDAFLARFSWRAHTAKLLQSLGMD